MRATLESPRSVNIVTSIYPPDVGGPAVYFASLKERLEKRGWTINVLVLPSIFSAFSAIRAHGIVLAHGTPKVLLLLWFVRLFRPFKLAIRIGGDFFWERAVEEGRFFGTLRDFYAKYKIQNTKYKVLRWFLGGIFRSADALVFTSPLLRDIYVPFFKLDAKRIHLISHPLPELLKVPHPLPSTLYPTRLLYAGRFLKLKNIEMLIDVFAEAKKKHPEITLTLVGEGPERKNLESRIKNLGIGNVVEVKPPMGHEEILREISTSDLVVLPSLSEVSPNLFFDALAVQTPVLATKENGYLELFRNVFSFFDPMDRQSFMSALSLLLVPGALQAARARMENFNFRRSWEDTAAEYERILSVS